MDTLESPSRLARPMREPRVPEVSFPQIRYRLALVEGGYLLMRCIDGHRPHPIMSTVFPSAVSALRSLNSYLGR
jgi:hypothetical protein